MKIPQRKELAFFAVLMLGLAVFAALLFEAGFRLLERRALAQTFHHGPGRVHLPDPRWGWKPSTGTFESGSPEFRATGNINELIMNGPPYDAPADARRTRILVLGDSHTFAVGVSLQDTWPQALEGLLGPGFRAYNSAYPGYNLHQYLLRLKDQGPTVKPHYVVVGLSYATDLYDLLPADRGGWTYAERMERDYFDFDAAGKLVPRHWKEESSAAGRAPLSPAISARRFLEHFASFRYLRRSKLALFLGSKLKFRGQSLWPNMEVVLEREVSPAHAYQWRLFFALLGELQKESRRQGAQLVVVGIPYLPQVYDEVWDTTFGGSEGFSKTAAIERVAAWCRDRSIAYVDTLDAFRSATKSSGRWLHFRLDAHPNAEGHGVIARTLLDSGAIQKRIRP